MAKKKTEVKEELETIDKKYPSLILGLDISTACIGISIVFDDGEHEPEIIKITHVVPNIKNKDKRKIKGIEALILRKEIFEKEFLTQIKDMGITECVIESPLSYATGNSNAQTVSQLLQFNGLLSEAVYRVLGIVPYYISSYDARQRSFPELMSIRKFNKKGIEYPLSHIKKDIKDSHVVLFGSYPFDCDKKTIMMNMVCEKYPQIPWVYDKNGELKKQNYDACDSLVCVLAYINEKKYGKLDVSIAKSNITTQKTKASNNEEEIESTVIDYTMRVWGMDYNKRIILK